MAKILQVSLLGSIVLVAASCGKKSSGGGGGGGGDTGKMYTTSIAPSAGLSLAVPGSLVAGGGSTALRLFPMPPDGGDMTMPPDGGDMTMPPGGPGGPGGGSSEQESQGYSQLSSATKTVVGMAGLGEAGLLLCDVALAAQNCSVTSASCETTANQTVVMSNELRNSIKANMGVALANPSSEPPSGPEGLALMVAQSIVSDLVGKVGKAVKAPQCAYTYTAGAEFPSVMNIKLNDDFNVKVEYGNGESKKVKTTFDYVLSSNMGGMFGGEGLKLAAMPDMSSFSFSDTAKAVINYDPANNLMSSLVKGSSVMSMGSTNMTMDYDTSFALKSDANGKAAGLLTMDTGDFSVNVNFTAADAGGHADSKYSVKTKEGTFTLNAVAATGSMYLLGPCNKQSIGFMESVGMVMGAGTTSATAIGYTGPVGTIAANKYCLFEMPNFGGMPGAPGLALFGDAAKTSITVVSGTVTQTTQNMFFTESWDAKGELTYVCFKDTAAGACTSETGAPGEFASGFAEGLEAFNGNMIQVSVSGTNASAMGGDTLYMVPSSYDLAAQDSASGSYHEQLLGVCYFVDDVASLSTTAMTGYECRWFGDAAPVSSTVHVYRQSFNAEGSMAFTRVTSAVVTSP